MLNRQRALLATLQQCRDPITPITLIKLAFLAREESGLRDDRTFYEFVPYKYGPFSFSLYRELRSLRAYRYIRVNRAAISLDPALEAESSRQIDEMPTAAFDAVRGVVRQHHAKSQQELLDYVYSSYPWFASRSELMPRQGAPLSAPRATYTVGYGNTSIDGFLTRLLRAGIERIVDVRANPVSRKYGFAKRTLQRLTRKVGIQYEHVPELGIESAERRSLTSERAYAELFERYAGSLPGRAKYLVGVQRWLEEMPSALLCVEADAACCHRGPLSEEIRRRGGPPVQHLVA